MAEAIVSFLIERVDGVLTLNQGKLLGGAKKCVKNLQAELMKMRLFLKDAEKKQMENKKLHDLIENLRRWAFKIDDKVEEYAFEVAKSRKIWIKGVVAHYKRVFYGRQTKFQKEMIAFTVTVKKFAKCFEFHGVKKTMHEKEYSKRAPFSTIGMENFGKTTVAKEVKSDFEGFVGIEKDKKRVGSCLKNEIEKSQFLSIYVIDKDMVMQYPKMLDQRF